MPLSAWALAGLFCAVLYTNPLSTDPTEKVSLQVVSQGPFKEGDNVTLKCTADGNPPPSSYIFYMKVNLLRLTQGVHFVCSLVVSQEMKAAFRLKLSFFICRERKRQWRTPTHTP